jgi:hypothetical protein
MQSLSLVTSRGKNRVSLRRLIIDSRVPAFLRDLSIPSKRRAGSGLPFARMALDGRLSRAASRRAGYTDRDVLQEAFVPSHRYQGDTPRSDKGPGQWKPYDPRTSAVRAPISHTMHLRTAIRFSGCF